MHGAPIAIRSAFRADVPAVLPMVRALGAAHESWDAARYGLAPEAIGMYAQWLPERAADPRSVFLIAEEAGRAVGFLVGTVDSSIRIFRAREFGFIHDVFVEPAHRGQGAGRSLVEAALRRFAAMGVRQVRLETAAANEAARRLFESLGFRRASIELLRTL
jgi:ribosomal protein S18 acetylase RimI-like enzyme